MTNCQPRLCGAETPISARSLGTGKTTAMNSETGDAALERCAVRWM